MGEHTISMKNFSGSETSAGMRLFALSFSALFLELLVIRWVPSQVRLVAYYANLMLISSFLGLGIGAMLASRNLKLSRFFVPMMTAMVVFILLCSGLAMPGSSGEARFFNAPPKIVGYVVLVGIFTANTLMFVPIGEEVGRLFGLMPPLRAYCWDLLGSLAGTVLFGIFSIRIFSPLAGFAIVTLIYFLVFPRRLATIDAVIGLSLLGIIALTSDWGAVWSPYHYLTVHDPWGKRVNEPEAEHQHRMDPMPYVVRVNQDIYQAHTTIDPARYTNGSEFALMNQYNMVQYPLPYKFRPNP
ncbi:MAG TPA: hypothetical protein VKK61_01630, partial [Tepidisphaeraceae bacterium]|nr:hypothetical protein [Tepidisphaeraceae bacterium]